MDEPVVPGSRVDEDPADAAARSLDTPEGAGGPVVDSDPDDDEELVTGPYLHSTESAHWEPEISGAIAPAAATGRRKEAVARVRLVPGSGTWTVNGRKLSNYFPNPLHRQIVTEPLTLVGRLEDFDVVVRVHGGGITGQAGALRLAVARALNSIDIDVYRMPLKRAGMLTRDARVVERKKAGLKKARKAPQFSKR